MTSRIPTVGSGEQQQQEQHQQQQQQQATLPQLVPNPQNQNAAFANPFSSIPPVWPYSVFPPGNPAALNYFNQMQDPNQALMLQQMLTMLGWSEQQRQLLLAAAVAQQSNQTHLLTNASANNNRSTPSTSSMNANNSQDSLIDQHFRRSLGEDYNKIMAADKGRNGN